MTQNLKTNPMFWGGVAVLCYGVFLLLGGGLSLKALVAICGGGYLVAHMVAPTLAGKVKAWVVKKVKNTVSDVTDVVNGETPNILTGTMADVVATELKPISGDAPVYTTYFFKPADHQAIAYLATEAKIAGDDSAVEQIRSINDKFFTISVNRIKKDDENEGAV